MHPFYHHRSSLQPRRGRQQQQHLSEEESDDSSSNSAENSTFSVEENNIVEQQQQWVWPNQQKLLELFAEDKKKPENEQQISEMAEQSWLHLFKDTKCGGTVEWSPANNVVEWLLFLLHIDVSNGITRDILQKIIDLLWTLQKYGVVSDIELPTTAQQIEKLPEKLLKPPISLVIIILSLHNSFVYNRFLAVFITVSLLCL